MYASMKVIEAVVAICNRLPQQSVQKRQIVKNNTENNYTNNELILF